MNQEQLKEITPESQDLINKVYPEADAGRLQEWLAGSAHGQSLVGELEKNRHDVKNAGISRLGILVEVCANYHFRKDYKQDDRLPPDVRTKLGMQILETAARRALPKDAEERAVSNKMSEIYNEGVEEIEVAKGVNVFQIKEPAVTALAEVVEEVVGEWIEKDSPAAQIGKLQRELQVLSAQQQRIQDGAGESDDEAERLKQLAEAQTTHIEELGRKLRVVKEAGGETWDDAARQKAKEANSTLPEKTRLAVAALLGVLDPIKVAEGETEMPQGVDKANENLIKNFRQLPEFWRQYLFAKAKDGKVGRDALKAVVSKDSGLDAKKQLPKLFDLFDMLVKTENGNELLSQLPGVLRLQLEERRKAQAEVRRANQEKKGVRDYFAGHDLQLICDQDGSGFGVENELSRQLEKAQSLGVNIFEADKELTVSTGQTEVTDLSLIFDPQGRLKTTKIKAATLSLEVFKDPRLLEEEMISVFGSERKQESESNAYIFARGENGFVVKYNNVIIGQVSFNQMAGEMIINWQTQNGDLAGYSVAKRLNQEWNQGIAGLIENKLGRLELKAVAKPGAEKPAETVAEVVASVEPAPVEEALPPAKVELPAPVVEEPAAVEEMPPPQPEEKPAETVAEELPLRAQSTL